jgi:hypothetical protein
MKELEFEDMETPEVRFTKLMKDYTTLKQQRLILLRGHLDAVYGTHADYLSPLGEATIYFHDIDSIESFVIEGETPPDLEQEIWRSARRFQGLLLQVNTYWLTQAITQLYALGAGGDLNLDPLTTTPEEEAIEELYVAIIEAKFASSQRGSNRGEEHEP